MQKVRDIFQWIVLCTKIWKTSIVYPFFYRVKIIGYVQHYHQWFLLPGVVARISRFYSKCFLRGCLLKGFHNVHLHWRHPSSFKFLLSMKGSGLCPLFVFVIHPSLFIMFVPCDLETVLLCNFPIMPLLFRRPMKSSKCQFLHFKNKASWYSNLNL